MNLRGGKTPEQAPQGDAQASRSRLRKFGSAAATALVPKGVELAYGQLGKSRRNIGEALAAARETRARLLAESKLPIKTVVLADLVRSIDNVVAIAAAAQNAGEQHQLALVIFGLVVSIPIIVGGSQLILKLMDRFPVIITLGGMLLGWIAGTMAHTDPALTPYLPQDRSWHIALGVAGALLVLVIGKLVQSRRARVGA